MYAIFILGNWVGCFLSPSCQSRGLPVGGLPDELHVTYMITHNHHGGMASLRYPASLRQGSQTDESGGVAVGYRLAE